MEELSVWCQKLPWSRLWIRPHLVRLKNGKSLGSDDIKAELLKIGGMAVCQALSDICSKIWDSEFWPELWTQSIIICLFRKGDRSRCENYRTVSLINHSSKILLNIICQWLKLHLHRILSQEQGQFQEHRSTVKQIFTLQQLAEKHIKRQNKRIAQVFIDYKKAFDCIWHAALFQGLDHYGIPIKLCNLIANLYKSCQHC